MRMKGIHRKLFFPSLLSVGLGIFGGCSLTPGEPTPGPDKGGAGFLSGAALGAGSGAIIGAQVSAATGPGAWLGAGFGALNGLFKGLGIDALEEDQLRRLEEEQKLREIAWATEVLEEHYQRRLELHPNRDIFPADLFFDQDSSKLKPHSLPLISELAQLTRRRMPWSRIVIATYSTASDPNSTYAKHINQTRAAELAREFVHSGIEARRIATKAQTLPEPILIDPFDSPARYRQAVEIVLLDY